jgi:DNA repair protein RadA/Sms
MGKARAVLECGACGHRVSQWAGRCPSCGGWGTIAEMKASPVPRSGAEPVPLALEPEEPDHRLDTGFDGVDRVLGGGLVPGSVVLLAGEPGIGKSTLLLQLVARVAANGTTCLYASGEESRGQVAARAGRLAVPPDASSFIPGRDVHGVMDAAAAVRPGLLVVDSIQAIRDPDSSSLPGGPAQVRACADALIGLAKDQRTAVILAGQVTKDGDIAGPRTLEHAVDVVCSFDGDARTGLRVLTGGKNRFGPEGEVAWFEMSGRGLREVDPAEVLGPGDDEPGAATALVVAGRRALAVEIQALTAFTEGPPRRQVSGLDPRRFGLVAAVVDRAAGLRLSRSELYGTVAGGLRVDDPGADLAMAAALASAASGTAPPPGSAFVGEVGLTGAVRPAANLPARLAAAAASGVRTVYCAGDAEAPRGLRVIRVRRLGEAIGWLRPGRRSGRDVNQEGRPSPRGGRARVGAA